MMQKLKTSEYSIAVLSKDNTITRRLVCQFTDVFFRLQRKEACREKKRNENTNYIMLAEQTHTKPMLYVENISDTFSGTIEKD